MKETSIIKKTIIKPNASSKFKRDVTITMRELMKDYGIKGKDKEHLKAFENVFKSNLYYIIDNYFELK